MANRTSVPTSNAVRGGSLPAGPKRKPLAPLQVEVPSSRCHEAKPHAARPELRKRVGTASQKKGWWPKRNNVTRMSSSMVRQAYELLGSVVLRDPEEEAVARGWLSGRYNRDQVHQQAALEGTTVWSLPQTQVRCMVAACCGRCVCVCVLAAGTSASCMGMTQQSVPAGVCCV